ncbi:hypothetical protein L6R49_10340 [Myxococcota bacterium]|nr:hypothetical protein [Myxococcota bacterium]
MSAPSTLTLLTRIYSRGDAHPEPGSLAAADLAVLSDGLDAAWGTAELLLLEVMPNTASEELDAWEEVYGLHRALGSDDRRRARLAAARRFLPNPRPATFATVLTTATEGLAWTIVEPGAFRCDDPNSLTDTTDDVLDGTFVFWAQTDADDARADNVTRAEVQDLVDRMAQAHTRGTVRFTGAFLCDDPWSLTDTDLLGA